MKTVCIVQARRRSNRLPDKVLLDLAGQPVLSHVLRRCLKVRRFDQVVLAGVDDDYEQPLFDIADSLGVLAVRGSATDLVARFEKAADAAQADVIVRVTADCPLLDPDVCDRVVAARVEAGADYTTAVDWPLGLDCEAFTRNVLEKISANAAPGPQREHVTLWVAKATELVRLGVTPDTELIEGKPAMTRLYRWVLDYPEDYTFLCKLFENPAIAAATASWQDVVEYIDGNPDIASINAAHIDGWIENRTSLVRGQGGKPADA